MIQNRHMFDRFNGHTTWMYQAMLEIGIFGDTAYRNLAYRNPA